MTDTKKPTTTVAQDVEALQAVMDGQHAQTESAAEVLALYPELSQALAILRRDDEHGLYDLLCNLRDRLSRSTVAGKVADRDAGGRVVREAWVRWALTQPNPKPSWLAPYDDLSEPDKEADRQIFEAVVRAAAPPADPAAIGLRFGLGQLIVNTGTHDGEPAVIVDLAPSPGRVGDKAPEVSPDTLAPLRMVFPTAEQAKRVADALVNADPAKASEPEYDRSLIADMLEDAFDTAPGLFRYSMTAIAEQIRLLRAADNADAAKVRTVRSSGSAPDVSDEAIERALDARIGIDNTLRQLIRGDTMAVGYSKVDVVRALLAELGSTATPPASAPTGCDLAAEAIAYHNAVGALECLSAAFSAMDQNDTELEEWPQRAIDALACAGWAVVPCDLPYAVLGEAGMIGAFATGNPKHGWDFLVSKTRIGPHGEPKPASAPEVTDSMVERAAIAIANSGPERPRHACATTFWHYLSDYERDGARKRARAALTAALQQEGKSHG